jgi:hypothetical protein
LNFPVLLCAEVRDEENESDKKESEFHGGRDRSNLKNPPFNQATTHQKRFYVVFGLKRVGESLSSAAHGQAKTRKRI